MKRIRIYNPYFEKEYKVTEGIGDIERTLANISRGNEEFVHLHDFETGNPITISPKCCASVEVLDADSD